MVLETEPPAVAAYLLYGWKISVGTMQTLLTEIGTDLVENELRVVVVPGRELAVGFVLGKVVPEGPPIADVPVPGADERSRLLNAAGKARLVPIVGGREPTLVLVGDRRGS